MAHRFDSGLAQPQRTRVRRGAVTLLSGLKRSAGGYLMDVIPWGGIVRVYTDVDGISALVNALSKAPAIAVAVGDRSSKVSGIGGFSEMGELDLLVYFATNNIRNQQIWRQETDVAGLADDQADPGLDVILDHAKELLIGQVIDAGKDVKQLRPEREYELVTDVAVTIWVQEYKLTVQVGPVPSSEFRTAAQLLTSLRFRAATNPAEVHLPAAPIDPGTIDFNHDTL